MVHVHRHSGPQGKVVPLTIIDDPADWKAKDWEGREAEYTYFFTPEDIIELAAAVDALKARGVSTEDDITAVSRRSPILVKIPLLCNDLHPLLACAAGSPKGIGHNLWHLLVV